MLPARAAAWKARSSEPCDIGIVNMLREKYDSSFKETVMWATNNCFNQQSG